MMVLVDSAGEHESAGSWLVKVDERQRVSRHVRLPVHAPWLCAPRAAPNTAPSWQVHVIACHEKGRLIIAAKDRKSVVPQRFLRLYYAVSARQAKTVSSAFHDLIFNRMR